MGIRELKEIAEKNNFIIPIIIHGNEILRQKTWDNIQGDGSKLIAKCLIETLKSTKNGVGLAAPQIGISANVFVTWADRSTIGSEPKVFINSNIITLKGSEQTGVEGCLSIPGIFARVKRYQKVKIKYYDENHNLKENLFREFEARVIQHEADHCSGLCFYDRLSSTEYSKIENQLKNMEVSKELLNLEYETERK